MKRNLLLLLLTVVITLSLKAQSQKETITKTASFRGAGTNRVLSVANIHGDVIVEAYKGNQVVLVAEKMVTGEDKAQVAKRQQELQVQMVEAGDSIYVYLDAPFINRKKGKGRSFNENRENHNYRFRVDMTLKVPAHVKLLASTVNEGEIRVSQVEGDMLVRHVNGPVSLTGVRGKVDAATVNGPITVNFAQNAPAASKFKTINGDIRVSYAGQLHGNLSFKSMHGAFFTDLDKLELQPAKVIRNTQGGSSTLYKIEKDQHYKAGKGGALLHFETLNGNIYLKKKEAR